MRTKKSICVWIFGLLLLAPIHGDCAENEKIGILFMGSGMDESYRPDWFIGYQEHLYPIFPPGFMAGGPLEGDSCYSLIHYANEAEAAVCSQATGEAVDIGTPIDIFCNEYTKLDEYPVHSIFDHRLFGENGFLNTCYPGIVPYFIGAGHSTTDPVTGKEIIGPHVDDPHGPGIGIADFSEQIAFAHIDYHYYLVPDYLSPYRKQYLRWLYGNNIPSSYGYPPEASEAINILDELYKALSGTGTTVVARHGWVSYMKNHDPYGNDLFIPDSLQTALEELINDEKVDRIIVQGSGSLYANITNWGYCWRNADNTGLSRLDNATYFDCITNIDDGYGPGTSEELGALLTNKPWHQYASPYPVIKHMAEAIDPAVTMTFAPAYGDYPEFDEAVLAMLRYTIEKYQISSDATLKVITGTHGYGSGYMNGGDCDAYFVVDDRLDARVTSRLDAYLATAWNGKYSVAAAENEFSQPSEEGAFYDPPSSDKPMGDIISTGEHIDLAINGRYVNELGQVVDNGNNNYDYVIAIPIIWDAENVDTISHFRHETLGNHELQTVSGSRAWIRQGVSKDGDEYQAGIDYDDEYFTVAVMDASGWESTPAGTWLLDRPAPVKKGSSENPTTVILTGTMLSAGNSRVRTSLTAAAVASIRDAIDNPSAGGYLDATCEAQALNMVVDFSAEAHNGSVVLSWKTLSEVDSRGFALYRAESSFGPYEKVNSSPVSPTGNATSASSYTYTDNSLTNLTPYYYRLEHSFSDTSATYGPIAATPCIIKGFPAQQTAH